MLAVPWELGQVVAAQWELRPVVAAQWADGSIRPGYWRQYREQTEGVQTAGYATVACGGSVRT